MHEGLWAVQFVSNNQMYGKGMVVLKANRILGGDLTMYYTGKFTIADDTFESIITVIKYDEGMSVFGDISHFQLAVKGEITETALKANANVVGNESLKMTLIGSKKEDF